MQKLVPVWFLLPKVLAMGYALGFRMTKGINISSIEMPPCWNVFL